MRSTHLKEQGGLILGFETQKQNKFYVFNHNHPPPTPTKKHIKNGLITMRSYPRYIFEHSSWLYSAQNLPFTFSAVVQEVYSNDHEGVDLLGRHIDCSEKCVSDTSPTLVRK